MKRPIYKILTPNYNRLVLSNRKFKLICKVYNIKNNLEDFIHAKSLEEIPDNAKCFIVKTGWWYVPNKK